MGHPTNAARRLSPFQRVMDLLDSARSRAGLLVAALGLGIAVALLPYATGLLGTVVLFVICAPLHRLLAPRMGSRRAALLLVVVTALGLVLPAVALVGVAVDQAPQTLRELQESRLLGRLTGLEVAGVNVGAQAAELGGAAAAWLSRQALEFVGSATRSALNLVISLFGLYYLLVSADAAWRAFRHWLPFSEESAEALRDRFRSVTEATLLGTAATALAQGLVVGIGFRLTGLDDALFWGVATGIASVVPVVGSAVVWLPGVAVLAMDGRYGAAAALLAVGGGIAANVDNFIRPAVFRRVSDIHPMITLVGAFAGLRYFGLLGVLLGPLAIAYFFELLRMYAAEYGPAAARRPRPEVAAPPAALAPPHEEAAPAVG